MPAARWKRKRTPDDIPSVPGDPERKRVLNILAQRRYRQKLRERIAALEARARDQGPPRPDSHDVMRPISAQSSAFPPSIQSEDFSQTSDGSCLLGLHIEQNLADWPSLEEVPNAFYPPTTTSLPAPELTHTQSPAQLIPCTSSSFPFSNDTQLQVPILNAMRAFASIFTALDILDVIWDPTYLHVLPNPSTAVLRTPLPRNLQPTPAQLTIPHHPVLDALPWPSVREKLICMLSLPSMFRPPIAQDSTDHPTGTGQAHAVQRLMHDLDDLQDGTRVYGHKTGWDGCSELSETAWEMGECFYRNWWFCVDGGAVLTTNRWRRERGVPALTLRR